MAYAPIAKLEKFTDKEDNAQIWLNNIKKIITVNRWNNAKAFQAILYFLQNTANSWYQSLTAKPQKFQEFKIAFLGYFSNNNSINHLVNTFTTIKQGENEAVTTYLGCFHRNLHQIQTIQADYFTVPQILNQFIRGLHTAVTNARNFEAAELEANHVQTVNLVMNGSSELNSKLKQFKSVVSIIIDQLTVATRNTCLPLLAISSELPTYDAAATLLTTSISSTNLLTDNTGNLSTIPQQIQTLPQNLSQNRTQRLRLTQQSWRLSIVIHQLILSSTAQPSKFRQQNLGTENFQNLNVQHYLSLLVTPKDTSSNNLETNQEKSPINNIPLATITNNELLAAIFSFELKETTTVLLFSGAILDTKPITAMYTDAKVDGHVIKLILDIDYTVSTHIIITDGATKTPIGEINDFPFEVNGIIISIKVLVMEAIQYQALTTNLTIPLIKFEEEEKKFTWEAYQVSWANTKHNELPPIPSWDDNGKGKQREELT
ncbi:hypothetical protein G9A89_004761 [Geosiphon pyriformis]|nr:hypothetical protein G9A89_004761 [Geosiphon pyriformis]